MTVEPPSLLLHDKCCFLVFECLQGIALKPIVCQQIADGFNMLLQVRSFSVIYKVKLNGEACSVFIFLFAVIITCKAVALIGCIKMFFCLLSIYTYNVLLLCKINISVCPRLPPSSTSYYGSYLDSISFLKLQTQNKLYKAESEKNVM